MLCECGDVYREICIYAYRCMEINVLCICKCMQTVQDSWQVRIIED